MIRLGSGLLKSRRAALVALLPFRGYLFYGYREGHVTSVANWSWQPESLVRILSP